MDPGFRRDDGFGVAGIAAVPDISGVAGGASVPDIDATSLDVLLELPQDRVAAGDGVVERRLGLALAGEDAFEILGDDVADLHQIAEPQPPRILGRRLAGQLQARDLPPRVLVREAGR